MKHIVLYVSTYEGKAGIHGFGFDSLTAARYAKVPLLLTPEGYKPKLTGVQLKDEAYDPSYGECRPKNPIVKREKAEVWFIDAWCDPVNLVEHIAKLGAEHITIIHDGFDGCELPEKPAAWTVVTKAKFVPNYVELNKSKGEDREGMLYAIRNRSYRGESLNIVWYQDNEYWEADKSLPAVLNHKWSYSLTSDMCPTIDAANGRTYYEYFLGDHAKSNDELEVLGKEDPETGFALVWVHEPCDVLDSVTHAHAALLWEGKRKYEQYDVINMVNINTVLKPKIQFEIRNFGVGVFEPIDYNRRLVSGDGSLVSVCLTPPRISYRVMGIRDEYRQVLDTYLGNTLIANLCITDITHVFIEEGKLSKQYGTTTDMLQMTANNHVGDLRPLQLIRGLELPPRSVFANSVEEIKRIVIVTWPFSERVYRYGVVVEMENSVSLWAAGYSGKMFCL